MFAEENRHRRAVGEILRLGERLPARTWLLIGVAFAGILVMFGGEAGGGKAQPT